MSDRGRNRRPARSTKATPPKAAAAEPDASTEDEVTEATPATAGEAEETTAAEVSDAAEADESDESETSDGDDADGKDNEDDKAKAKPKGPAPLTKAEKRAAARVAAAKVARRKRVGQAIAGSIIVLLAIGGAFAGVWYFGDRAEQKKTECKPMAESSYPPMLGGFDKRLAEEPKVDAGGDQRVAIRDVKTVIQGNCKTVKPGDTVVVNYVGATYKDGKVFDSSWTRKQTFPVQVGMAEQNQQPQVIEGWDRGLVGVKVGSRIILDIPAKEAYGDTPQQQGAPAGDLRFVVDVLDIQAPDASGGLQIPGN
ncbi:FKBP-type peptidyl-prolyl cis-trans isomerase [Dactylosporangium sp. CA-139066]|uniref:FKBP-type peptidyl-prolyl cis-trans isomerase n=1 Tax=Dactylosporangium sp. CA-139066 TaxID=3239930 RepID=UPI003D8D4858